MALLVILCAALYGTYFSIMTGRESATAGMEGRRELRSTLDMLRQEIASAYFNKGNKRLHFVVEDRDFFGKPASIFSFTAIAPPGSSTLPGSDLVDLKYQPVEKDGKIALMRQSRDLYLDVKPYPYPQMEELEGFLVECYDGSKWVKSWDTALNFGLPKSVRITLRIREGEKTVEFVAIASPKVTGT